ncbi:MAG: hypothetical protein DRJ51_05375 [Thermoprotei archaeon]|nr:MAG: hypothetical protein DRJ51_05375 [Thermoprotei archaeon]RLE81199.1 MAG: hypothetical protein DRJ36_01545 [Thermoprotei archaeon]
MYYWKIPPRIKVLEALGSIADERVKFISNNEARVTSSTGERVYTVKWDGGRAIVSDDNGSVYRGYLGYPSIAFLMLKGVLPYNEKLARALKGIPWKRLNEKYKSYAVVERIIKSRLKKRGIDEREVDDFIGEVLEKISELKFIKLEVE